MVGTLPRSPWHFLLLCPRPAAPAGTCWHLPLWELILSTVQWGSAGN